MGRRLGGEKNGDLWTGLWQVPEMRRWWPGQQNGRGMVGLGMGRAGQVWRTLGALER